MQIQIVVIDCICLVLSSSFLNCAGTISSAAMSAMSVNIIIQNIYNLNDLRSKNKLFENTMDREKLVNVENIA